MEGGGGNERLDALGSHLEGDPASSGDGPLPQGFCCRGHRTWIGASLSSTSPQSTAAGPSPRDTHSLWFLHSTRGTQQRVL